MSKIAKRILTIVGVVALLAVVAIVISRSGSRSALQSYKAELRAKGEKLTFAELAVPPSTNAAHIAALNILAAFSTNSSVSIGQAPKVVEYIAPGKARVAWRDGVHIDGGVTVAIASDWPTLERQHESAAPALQQIRSAMENPPPDSGWIYTDNYTNGIIGPPRTFVRDRTYAQALARAELVDLHRGNLDGALSNLHALVGFVRMQSNDLTVVSQMIRVAIAGLGLGGTWEALQAPGWDEARLASLQMDWERAEFLHGFERSIEGERSYGQLVAARVRNGPLRSLKYIVNPPMTAPAAPRDFNSLMIYLWQERLQPLGYRMMGDVNEDELFMLQHSTRLIELARSIEAGRPWPEVVVASSNIMAQLEQAFRDDRFHRLRISAMAIPNFARAFETVMHTETQRRLAITAIAIKRYELKQGKPPGNLSDLTPAILARVPIDPMSGQPLCYRLNNDNTFVLYSAGDNGKDDGGSAGMTLWSPLDAVWPVAATAEEERSVKTTLTRK